ncbi:MAG TPA: ADP-dependent glucokinase/phosphofructokinase [Chthoniobacterales bacterium]
MKTEDWGKVYRDLLERLPAYVRDARLTICGLSTFLDGYVRLHEAAPLLNAKKGTPPEALSRELFRRANLGIGGEYYLDWPEGGKWVEENLQFSRWGLGGSGAQAAQMLAIMGAPALMSLEDRSRRQLSVIHPNILVATKRGVIKCGELPATPGRKPAHYIFEFTAGTQVGSIIPKRSSRTIVRFTDERLDADADFTKESMAASASAGAGILSGFNEIGEKDIDAALADTIALAKAWRDRGLKTIHLELGDYATAEGRDTVLEKLRGTFTSLGMSYSELCALCGRSPNAIGKALELSESLHLSRLCVHADTWALAITKGDPQRELAALLCGCLFASARAERGEACRPMAVPANAEFHDMPLEKFNKSGERFIVCCASPYLQRPVATIGLGDTFLAGTLLVLGRAEPPLANVQP